MTKPQFISIYQDPITGVFCRVPSNPTPMVNEKIGEGIVRRVPYSEYEEYFNSWTIFLSKHQQLRFLFNSHKYYKEKSITDEKNT
jgi:hypothetical protein